MSKPLHSDFDLLWDIKSMEDIIAIARGEPHHSSATIPDLIGCFNDCGLEPPPILAKAYSNLSLSVPHLLEEIRRYEALNKASIEQMNENQETIDKLKATLAVCNNKIIIDIALSEIIRLRAEVKRLNSLVGYT